MSVPTPQAAVDVARLQGRPQTPPRRWTAPIRIERLSLGAAPYLAVIGAAGLLVIAIGNNAARESASGAELLFWSGLVLIYAPFAFRLFSTSASRTERIALALLLGLILFFVKVLHSPANFDLHDELGTWRQTSEILRTGHFFSANPLVEGYAGYPTISAVTAALVQLGHLSIFHAALVVSAVARLTLMLILFIFLERVSGSTRAAGIGMAIYACNPNFLYFDSQFAYESLALPIAAALLLITYLWTQHSYLHQIRLRSEFLVAIAVLVPTLTITHHMSSYAMLAFFLLWAGIEGLLRWRPLTRLTGGGGAINSASAEHRPLLAGPLLPALLLVGAIGLWFTFVAGAVTRAELGGTLSSAVKSLVGLVFGTGAPKTLFQSSAEENPLIVRLLAIASVIPLLAMIPFGLIRTWRRPSPSIWKALAVVGALYPVTLGLRLTLAGTETSQRASEFVYVGLAFLAAILLSNLPRRARGKIHAVHALGFAGIATIIFLGGFVVGESPETRQPGPFLVSAEARSVNAASIAAAQFAARHLSPHTPILTDRPNTTFLASYSHLDPVQGYIDGRSITTIIFDKKFTSVDKRLIKDGELGYLVVDGRLSRELPASGIYFDRYEPHAFAHRTPISHHALTKFQLTDGLNRIYANGPIVIYETSETPAK